MAKRFSKRFTERISIGLAYRRSSLLSRQLAMPDGAEPWCPSLTLSSPASRKGRGRHQQHRLVLDLRRRPNNALQLTAYSLRYAPASGSS